MSADIVERLRALSRCEHSDLSIGDEAAAEIVRLRGEVARLRVGDCRLINGEWWTCNDPADGKFVRFQGSHHPVIAPAEAKGDCRHDWVTDGVHPTACSRCGIPSTPQPADGGAVAFNYAVVHRFATEHGVDYNRLAKLVRDSVYAHPQAAHPSACELGADTTRLDWLEANCVDVADEYGTGSQLYFGTYATAPLRTAIDRALQHRGDSRGGEGS